MASSARTDAQLRPSVLDRLIAPAGAGRHGSLDTIGLRELYQSVARDLDWLLNTKRWLPEPLEIFPEASESILTYGLPDLSIYSWRNHTDSMSICRLLEETIRRFEPRLRPRTVQVKALPAGEIDDFRVRFRIDAMLQVEPIRAHVRFDTEFDLGASGIRVKGEL
jgi:type VI secretion system protein ImpF